MTVMVIDTTTANIASMMAALRRAGANPVLTRDADAIASAKHVVLPGVGAFGAGITSLRRDSLDDALRMRREKNRPLLAVCLGLQLLFTESDESPGASGLGLLKGKVSRFDNSVLVPQLGWNRVAATANARWLRDGFAYYANSYRLDQLPAGLQGATSNHGGCFVAALEYGNWLACQFHPELSGAWGQSLIERWLAGESRC